MSDEFSFSFCISDNYAQHLAVVIASILVNNPDEKFVFHVFNFELQKETEVKLLELETMYPNCRIAFHRIERSRFDGIEVSCMLAHITKEAFLRYLAPEVLADEKRTIYSDVDVLCVGDIREVWEADLGGRPVGAVAERCDSVTRRARLGLSPNGSYFCSGLIVMDLDKMRKEGISQRLVDAARRHQDIIVYADQDPFNMVLDSQIASLPPSWHCTDGWSPFRSDVRMWHFQCQTHKPWCNIWKNITWIPYLKYLLKTPYRANAWRFIFGHIKGFLFYSYEKKMTRRYLVCGIRVWKRKSF